MEKKNNGSEASQRNEMNRKQYWTALVIIGVCGILWMAFVSSGDKPDGSASPVAVSEDNLHHEYRMLPLMGTMCEISLYGRKNLAEKAADAAADKFREVQDICNIFNPESEISKLNRSAFDAPFKCSQLLWNVLQKSREAYDVSGGAFDITAKPLMDLWGFYRKRGENLPSADEVSAARRLVGLERVHFDDDARTVQFTVKGMSFDLGGIAKGYAVDVAAAAVLTTGISRGLINLGGNMYCLPDPPPGKKNYRIGITNPLNKKTGCGVVEGKDISLATSGNYERYVMIDGVQYTHIMNVKTGIPVRDMLSVTVITDHAVDADFLSTSIFINGPEFAKEVCKRFHDTQVLIIRRDAEGSPEVIKIGKIWGEITLDTQKQCQQSLG
eukprot:TRINITY_DN9498_c0_g2_i1.p1 TRINITY_DN9498_c0_g2~~TRINITY_DN9498_c0_g2_i1.p1  ORF type:complete len:384 (-),score=85.71 TRINITY_DN9498_c0_g2_i1:257-1408(-)